MKTLITIITLTLIYFNNAFAITLYDALNLTYKNNIQLNAERENIKVSEEDINISKADYKPSLSLSGSKSIEDTNKLTNQSGGDATINDVDPFTTSIKLEQTLLDYGRDLTLQKNIIGLDLAKAELVKKEQIILYKAVESYTNLILSRETLDINRKNLDLLKRQFENDKIRRDRGRITNTDLAQSESSLAGAQAQFVKAQSDLLISKLNYENIIGEINDLNQLQTDDFGNSEHHADFCPAFKTPDLDACICIASRSFSVKPFWDSELFSLWAWLCPWWWAWHPNKIRIHITNPRIFINKFF